MTRIETSHKCIVGSKILVFHRPRDLPNISAVVIGSSSKKHIDCNALQENCWLNLSFDLVVRKGRGEGEGSFVKTDNVFINM